MYFLLISIFLLFSLLAGYTGLEGEWVMCIVFALFALYVLLVMYKRYHRGKKTDDSVRNDWFDCFYLPECFPSGSHRRGDCDCDSSGGGDCGGLDCTP